MDAPSFIENRKVRLITCCGERQYSHCSFYSLGTPAVLDSYGYFYNLLLLENFVAVVAYNLYVVEVGYLA